MKPIARFIGYYESMALVEWTGAERVPVGANLYALPVLDRAPVISTQPVVPASATPEMIEAAEQVEDMYRLGRPELFGKIWKAMLAAAPSPQPAIQAGEAVLYVRQVDIDTKARRVLATTDDDPDWSVPLYLAAPQQADGGGAA